MSSVDVIVPCYKYGHYLRQCVESILNQDGVDVRVLIIDDASPDDSAVVAAQLAKEDARVHFVHHQQNRGHIATYNEGIDWVSGDYMLLLSADDYLLPGAFSRAAAMMNEHPDIAFVCGWAQELYPNGNEVTTRTGLERDHTTSGFVLSGSEFVEMSSSRNRVPTPTGIVRTSVGKAAGGYRADLPHTADMEMWLRLAAHGSVGVIAAPQAVYRRHNANMSSGYVRRYWTDLQERHGAIDGFFATFGDRIPGAKRLQAGIHDEMYLEAINQARNAFAQGDDRDARRLTFYAASLSPRRSFSWLWLRLACKHALGATFVGAVKALLSPLRKASRTDS